MAIPAGLPCCMVWALEREILSILAGEKWTSKNLEAIFRLRY
jgi:hypothetical protein